MASSSSNAGPVSCTDSVVPTTYDIFISYAQAQKGFARDLYKILKPRYSGFPISHVQKSADHAFPVLQDASKTCRLALLVLSPQFLCSKSCMLELCAFIDAMSSGLKVVPLYFNLLPSDLTNKNFCMEISNNLENLAGKDQRISVPKCTGALKTLRSLFGPVFDPSIGELEFLERITASISKHQLLNSSSALSHMYDIYLSHSGAQKGFVKGLFKMLSPTYKTFFDINLPPGTNLVRSIYNVANNCKLAVVVISEEFLTSKFPMLELSWFLKASPPVNILPIFYMLHPSELKDPSKLLEWEKKWKEMSWEGADFEPSHGLRMLRYLNGIVFHSHEGELSFLNRIISAIYQILPAADDIEDSGNLQGMDRMCKIIIHKLEELESKQLLRNPTPPPQSKVCVLGMYGLMGCGKSSLSRCLCNRFFSEFMGKVLYMELPMNCTPAELTIKLKGLFYLTNCIDLDVDLEGISDLQQRANLRDFRIFLVLDNISSEESVKSVETILQLGIGPGSKVMLVARSIEILRPLLSRKYEGHYYVCDTILVPSLDEREAFRVLSQGDGMGLEEEYVLSGEAPRHEEALTNVLCLCDFGPQHHCLQLYNPLLLKAMGAYGKIDRISDVGKWGTELQNFVAKAEWREKVLRGIPGESFNKSSSMKSVRDMELDSSSFPAAEESGLPISMHEVFLSHSGVQKGFANDLYQKLSLLYTTFFDIKHHSLPPTEKFPEHILSAAKKCRLAVVVLSKEFVCSRWPMTELCTFVAAMPSVKILPLFFELTPDDLSNEKIEKQWHTEWGKLAQSNSNHPIDTSAWSNALKTVKSTIGPIFKRLEGLIAYLDEIMCCISEVVPPAIKCDDRLIYGKNRLLKIILDKLEKMESTTPLVPSQSQVCVLGLYGPLGSGKSTLSKCLRDHFFSQFSGRSLYLELPTNPSPADLRSKFKELLELTNFNNAVNLDKISDLLQVYNLLEANRLSSFKVCLVVDNLSSEQSVQEITRVLHLGVGPGSKVILVGRSLKILYPALRLPGKPYIYDSISIPSINETEAIQILLERTGAGVGFSGNALEEVLPSKQRKIVEGVVQMCRFESDPVYLPLVMETMGSLLFRYHEDVERWGSELESWARVQKYKESAVRDLVGESFKALSKQLQLLFLDVVLFALPFHDGKSINIDDAANLLKVKHESNSDFMVMKIRDLEKHSFLTISSSGIISVHDVYMEFAKSIQQQPLDS